MARPPKKSTPLANKRPEAPANESEAGTDSKQPVSVPVEAAEIIRGGFGLDLSQSPEDIRRQVELIRMSISRSPYPAPDMLFAYEPQRPGFADRIINVIDEQRAHRQRLEIQASDRENARLDRAQRNAFVIGAIGLIGAIFGGYLGIDRWICITVATVAVGGPNAATIISRFIGPNSRGGR